MNSLRFQIDLNGAVSGYEFKGTGMTSVWKKSDGLSATTRINLSKEILNAYTGKYLFEPNMLFEVILDEGKLFGRVGNDQKELVPFGKNKFYTKDIDATIIFNHNKLGETVSLTKIQNSEMTAKKL